MGQNMVRDGEGIRRIRDLYFNFFFSREKYRNWVGGFGGCLEISILVRVS